MKLKSLNLVLASALLVVVAGAEAQTRFFHSAALLVAQAATAASTTQQPSVVADEESLPQDPKEREARLAKSLRYNGGGGDLTKSDDLFFEQYEPRALPVIPFGESTIAFKGQVAKMQSYLSADRTHIYTEITLQIEETFKQPKDFRVSSDQTLIVTQTGGAIKLRSGRVISDHTRAGFMGKPYVGGRYVLFADRIHRGQVLTMIKAYELRTGKVLKLTEDGSPGAVMLSNRPDRPDSLSDEQTFLQAVRARATKENGANHSRGLTPGFKVGQCD